MRLGAISTLGMTILLAAAGAAPAWGASSGSGGAQAPSGQDSSSQQQSQTQGQTSDQGGSSPSQTQSGQSNQSGSSNTSTGGSAYGSPNPLLPEMTVPGTAAKIVHGYAEAPSLAPPAVQQAIWAANAIVGRPYVYGGGHGSFVSAGYDCSGTVSYALHGGMLLASPLDSGEFETWGTSGRGQWISIYANGGHAYMNIAGIRLDTSSAGDPSGLQGPRWRPIRRSNRGYTVRHPLGL